MIYEILNGKTVINTIVADAEFMTENYPNGNFREIEIDLESVDAPVYEWYIDVGSFIDRFGDAKMSVLLSDDVGVKTLLADINARKWVDLKNTSTIQIISYITTKVPQVTEELSEFILNTPVSPSENMVLRKLYFS